MDLTLQTAEPTFGGKIPRLHPWVIYRSAPEEGGSFGSSFGSFSGGSYGGSVSMTRKGDSTAPRAGAAETHHEEPHVNIIATFMIEGKIHIPCDGTTHSVTTMRLNLDSKTHWVAVPKREARTHLRVGPPVKLQV